MDIATILEWLGIGSISDNSNLANKNVLIIKGNHAGKHGRVVQLVGRKMVKVSMIKWKEEGVVRTSSIVMLPDSPHDIQRRENGLDRQVPSIDVSMPIGTNYSTPSTPVAEVLSYCDSSIPHDLPGPQACIATPVLCLGAKVICVRGTHIGKEGIVSKVHARMVTVLLNGRHENTVRILKSSVVVAVM
jgi:ribosomal protein S4E